MTTKPDSLDSDGLFAASVMGRDEFNALVDDLTKGFNGLLNLNLGDRVKAVNAVRAALAAYSPFSAEPVDHVQWVRSDEIEANDYNPNSVAPPEMELLRLSIM